MGVFKIRKGLDVPIAGEPGASEIEPGRAVRRVGLVGDDYVGMRPTMAVSVGDSVRTGQLLFTDKKTEGVRYTSPGTGKVLAIHRGAKRKFESIVIELAEREEPVSFASYSESEAAGLDAERIRENLIESGMWTAFRTRPFSRVPLPESTPHAIFVTAIDTRPLAPDPVPIVRGRAEAFRTGMRAVAKLCPGTTYLCRAPGEELPGSDLERVRIAEFQGPHPAGLAGTHIHFLDPVGPHKTVWTIGYQDVIAIGELFRTGELFVERIVSLAGPSVRRPRRIRTRLGANLEELTREELGEDHVRRVSGSVLGGRTGTELRGFLGRYHNQVTVLREGDTREFLGWQKPGLDKYSVKNVFLSALRGRSTRYEMTTNTNGSPRAMVPIGMYERVMPLDILPTFLLRALIVRDTDQAQALGCLELDEDDLALCTFVCPGKTEYGPILRDNLTLIEKEG